jgi:nitroreductase / dihydropteridine reductase
MSIITALNWRYAAKRMNGTKVPKAKMDVIMEAMSLAPSSFGLQPYSILVIEREVLLERIKPIARMQPQITEASSLIVFATWDKITQERINTYITQIAKERNITEESLQSFRDPIEAQLNNSEEDNFNWNSRQAYIALGFGLVAAAEEGVDSTPMEGFDREQLDELLFLKDKGLRSTVLMALGYRDAPNDYLVNLKKIRRVKDQLFAIYQ